MPLPSKIKSALRAITPPILLKAIKQTPAPSTILDEQALCMDAFYAGLVAPGSLCFDIGANSGNRVAAFRRLGFRVVAVEPQSRCHAFLQTQFGQDPQVTLIHQAVGRTCGKGQILISNCDVLSTLSPDYIAATTRSGRFSGIQWDRSEEVELTTIDTLIAAHGQPGFIKIDIEGFELEAVLGLSRPIKLIALEWTPEFTDNTLACIDHLCSLGQTCFNLSWGESQRLARQRWLDAREIKTLLTQFREETYLFADLYARTNDV